MNGPNDFPITYTLAETVYNYLKKSISSGELKPGQRLHEKEIAEKFKISVTPVREAFLRLAAEKFLANNARHEVQVIKHSVAEAMDLYEIIRVLELYLIKKFVKTMTPEKLDELKRMTQDLAKFYDNKEAGNYLDMNLRIHKAIWKTSDNKAMYDTLVQTLEKTAIFRMHNNLMPFSDPKSWEKSLSDHTKLIEGLEKKDIKGLETVILSHWGEDFGPGEKESGAKNK